jgi:hypothetical protein
VGEAALVQLITALCVHVSNSGKEAQIDCMEKIVNCAITENGEILNKDKVLKKCLEIKNK